MTTDNHRRPGEEAATDARQHASSVQLAAVGGAFGLSSLQCPDCGARQVGVMLTHADTCPLNRGMDLVCDEDRDWFAAHPAATEYRRPVTPAEVADQLAAGLARPVGTVTVFLLAPGLRSRYFEYEDGAR